MISPQKHLSKTDPILKKIIDTIPTPEVISTNNVFHDLMSCIIEQQIHYRSTKKVFQKMLDAAEISLLTPDDFPDLERKSFKNVKLSAKKYETIANVLDFWETNKIDWTQLSDPEVKTRLSKIKGVGPWTIDMILLYTLKRPDIFNYDDFHIKQIMTTEYGLNPKVKLKAQMKEVAEPWRPFRSTAFRYLLDWKYFKNQKSAI